MLTDWYHGAMTIPARPPMAQLTGYRLIKVGEELLAAAEEALTGMALKARHLNVLMTVKAHPGLSQQELSRVIGIDVNAMVVVMDFLELNGLAVRDRNPSDRRRHIVRVSEEGDRSLRLASEAVSRREAEYLASLTPDEVHTLHALTGRLLRLDETTGSSAVSRSAGRSAAR
jgi:DNA-binding MarR family transcriptional regulator